MVLKLLDRIGIIGILIFSLVIKLILAFSTNLGNDEVYYVNFALYPNTSYFDHPPMVGWIIRAFTFDNALILNDFFVRLGAMLIGLINIFALYRIGILIRDKQTGILAAFLGSISFYVAIISGFFILPDTGLTLFWLLSIFTFIRYIKFRSPRDLIFFGLFVGLGMLSKYFSVYLWIAAFLYILKFDRKIFAKWQLWCSGFLSLLVFSPVIWWNLNSEYSGFNYHADRVGGDSWLPSFKFFFPEFFGQIFYNNPFVFILIVIGFFLYRKSKDLRKDPVLNFLIFCALPLIMTTLVMALYNRTLPHWSGPAYFSLILFASFMLMEYQKKTTKVLVSLGTGIFVLVIALGLFQGQTGMLIQDLNKKKFETGKKDFTIDLAMWDEMGSTIQKYISDEERDENFGIITHNWFPAAHLDYYFALPNQRKLIVHGDANRLHEYMRINKIRGGIQKGENYLWITTSHYFGAPDQKILDQFEDYSTNPDIIPVKSGSKIRVNLLIWKLIRAKG